MWIQKGVVESFSSHSKAYICGLILVIIKFIKKKQLYSSQNLFITFQSLEFFYINTLSPFKFIYFLSLTKKLITRRKKMN